MAGPLDPQAISFSDGSTARICRAASCAFKPYSAAVMCPICQGPSISLPRHQCSTLVRLFDSVTAPQVTPLGALLDVAVFDKRRGSLRRAGTEVQPHQWPRAHDLGTMP